MKNTLTFDKKLSDQFSFWFLKIKKKKKSIEYCWLRMSVLNFFQEQQDRTVCAQR